MLDYRFPTALQMVLCVAMAQEQEERTTSAMLANSVEANPSLIRKLMVPLTREGIFITKLGRCGSIHLGRSPELISMRDIYLAVTDEKKLLNSRPGAKQPCCVVSANVCWYFKGLAEEAEQASLNALANHSVADALREIKQGAKLRK